MKVQSIISFTYRHGRVYWVFEISLVRQKQLTGHTINIPMEDEPIDDDPLKIKDLAVQYDYLMFKISDHISNLADLTYRSVISKQQLIEQDYFAEQLDLEKELEESDTIMEECKKLETVYSKLDQLYLFVDEFKIRLTNLEEKFKELG